MRESILLYTDDPGLGGVAQYNHSLLCGLAAFGYRLSCVQSRTSNPLVHHRQELGIQHFWLEFDTTEDFERTLTNSSDAQGILSNTKPDLIIFSDSWALSNFAAKQVAMELGIPYIIVIGFVAPYPGGIPAHDLNRLSRIYEQAKAVIAVSTENLKLLHQFYGLPNDKGTVIYYGRPAQYFNSPQKAVRDRLRQEVGIPSDAVVCLTAARLEPRKGYQYQLAAIEQLKQNPIWPQLYFLWAGGGNLEAQLRETINQLGISNQVKLLGQRWDIPDWLDASDILLLPSHAEGMPLIVMEAMAKAIPVIASAVSGIPEQLDDTGKLLPDPKIAPQATVNELVETIQVWALNPELRQAIGQAGKRRTEAMFREERMVKETVDTIKRALLPTGDYVSPGFSIIRPDSCFPNMIVGNTNICAWSYLRREVPHNWYVDRRQPTIGFLNRDEAHILYNTALKFKGKKALEIGCWLGWSACHLALGGVELDVVDPLLSRPEFYESVSSSLDAAGVLSSVNLVGGYSPQKVEELASQRKWALIFIDGNHDAPAPLQDAIACEKYVEDDALILFHDLASPDVAQGLDYLRQKGWNTKIYQTMQIMGVAWRGNVEPVMHKPDPQVHWHLPQHLQHYPVSNMSNDQLANENLAVRQVRTMMQQALDLLKSGESIEAVRIAEQAASLGVSVPEMHFVRSICLSAVQKYKQSFDAAKAELEINPNHQQAQEIVNNYTKTMFARAQDKIPTRQRPWNTTLPRETLLSIQNASHRYSYKGVQMIKNPFDLALYPLLIWNLKPRTIIEIGSNCGGSALWLGDMLNNFGIDGHVFSIDILKVTSIHHPSITFMQGNGQALQETLTLDLISSLPRPLLVIEDADHSYETTKHVLEFFHPYLQEGEYIIIEDGIISDLTQDDSYGSGPHQALKEFLLKHESEYEIDSNFCDFFGYNITWCTNGFLKKVNNPSEPSTNDTLLKKLFCYLENYKNLSLHQSAIQTCNQEKLSQLNQHGKKFFERGNLEQALEAFTKAVTENPSSVFAHNYLSYLYWKKNDIQTSLKHHIIAQSFHPALNSSGNEEFQEVLAAISPYTLVSESRLFSLYILAKQICLDDIPGNFVECGAYKGGSSALLATVIKRHSRQPRRLYAFDTFEGMPEPTEVDRHKGITADLIGFSEGTLKAPISENLDVVCQTLDVRDIVVPVPGLFAQTLPQFKSEIGSIALLHADGDWYESTRDIFNTLYDSVVANGMVQVDDYGFWDGCSKAIHEFERCRSTNFALRIIDDTGVWFRKEDIVFNECNYWRNFWQLAQTAERMGDLEVAEKAARAVLQIVPRLLKAEEMLSRLPKKSVDSPDFERSKAEYYQRLQSPSNLEVNILASEWQASNLVALDSTQEKSALLDFDTSLETNKTKSLKKKALVFFPHNPYPARSGAHQRCLSMLGGLKELGYEVTLFGSTLITDNPWPVSDRDLQQLQEQLGVTVEIYQGTQADGQFVAQVMALSQARGDVMNWDIYTPPGLRKRFRELFRQLSPDVVVINYSLWGQLAIGEEFESAFKIVDCHDLYSLNTKMRRALGQYLIAEPFTPDQIDSSVVAEDFYSKLKLEAEPDEYRIFDHYDYTIAMSVGEAQLIRQHTHQTKVDSIPMTFTTELVNNTYTGEPLLVIGPNPFNVQGYLYWVQKVLPIVLNMLPEFKLQLVGSICQKFSPVAGIELLGYVPELKPLYAESPFAICPLIGGTGQQVKIVEAMAHGVPVIALRNVAESSPIEHGVNGFIAENSEEFAEYTIQLWCDRELCRRLGEAARLTIDKNFSQDLLVEKLKVLAEQVQEKSKSIASTQSWKIAAPKIIIDGIFFQLYQTGIARVWKSLLEEWTKTTFSKHIVIVDRGGTAPKVPGIRYRPALLYNVNDLESDRAMLQQVCDEETADLFISTYYTTPVSTPSVFMAYDMIPEILGWDTEHPNWRGKHHAIQYASAHTAISENTARDLVRFFPDIPLERVTVSYCGASSTFFPASSQEIHQFKTKYGISKPYFLLVGPGLGYKNSLLFFKAFSQLWSKQGFDIVCTGGGLLLDPELREYTSGTTVHMLQLSDEELSTAYSGAVALVYPSKLEGFGLPILEAMACGCPVITCPNASIPEVAGKAALYVNDEDVEGLANALCEVQKSSVRQSLVAAGLERAKTFSWSKMAGIVSSVLVDATLKFLSLKEINLIVFPDWSAPEESLSLDLQRALKAITNHPDKHQITLLVDTTGISEEDANLVLSGVAMNLLLEEELDVTQGPAISLVGQLGKIQWQALLSRLQARMILENENQEAIAQVGAGNLPAERAEGFRVERGETNKAFERTVPLQTQTRLAVQTLLPSISQPEAKLPDPSLPAHINLKEINLIVFPDWSQPEETLSSGLIALLKTVLTHPDRNRLTLLIDTSNIAEEDANLILSGTLMNLLLKEDLSVDDGVEIGLIGTLNETQWITLLQQIQGRIVLPRENQQALTQVGAENLPCCQVEHLRLKRFVQSQPYNFPIFLEHPVNPIPRYGYGQPPHPKLYEIIHRNKDVYAENLKFFLNYLDDFRKIPKFPSDTEAVLPFWNNGYFQGLDAISLYGFLCLNNPKRYVEVGAGNSTKFARFAIANQKLRTQITSIDPNPRSYIDSICDHAIREKLEEIDTFFFEELEENDILFIDNSHCCFMNSDVTVLFLDILPKLKRGVIVHLHDIFLPYDYPPEWHDRYYSEQYLLAAYLLAEGNKFDILLSNAFITSTPEFQGLLTPLRERLNLNEIESSGVSFWLRIN